VVLTILDLGVLESDSISTLLLATSTSPFAARRELVERPIPAHTSGADWRSNEGLVGRHLDASDMRSADDVPTCRVNSVPNEGIIRYLGMFNSERIIVTSPKALAEVLVTKNYDFVKPSHVARGIGKILGVGVLLAEGEEHKMQRKNLMPAFAFRHVKNLYPTFWLKSREVAAALTEVVKAKGQPEAISTDVEKNPESAEDAVIEVGLVRIWSLKFSPPPFPSAHPSCIPQAFVVSLP
jgi:hypothetical protein